MAYSASKILPYAKPLLYEIVADVRKYPRFLPWLRSARVYAESANYFEADLIVKFGPLEKAYKSEVSLTKDSIETETRPDGFFEYMRSTWRFLRVSDNETRVGFYVDFKLNSKILSLTVGKIFDEIAVSTMNAFEERAHAVFVESTLKKP